MKELILYILLCATWLAAISIIGLLIGRYVFKLKWIKERANELDNICVYLLVGYSFSLIGVILVSCLFGVMFFDLAILTVILYAYTAIIFNQQLRIVPESIDVLLIRSTWIFGLIYLVLVTYKVFG